MISKIGDAAVILLLVFLLIHNVNIMRSEILIQKAKALNEKGLLDEGSTSFKKASEIFPWSSSYHRQCGKSALKLYRTNSDNVSMLYMAQHSFQKSLELNSVYPYHWFELGETYELFMMLDIYTHQCLISII